MLVRLLSNCIVGACVVATLCFEVDVCPGLKINHMFIFLEEKHGSAQEISRICFVRIVDLDHMFEPARRRDSKCFHSHIDAHVTMCMDLTFRAYFIFGLVSTKYCMPWLQILQS